MGVLVNAGRIKMCSLLKASTLHVAWGNGSVAWDSTPEAEPLSATTLVAEVGRRVATQVEFCVPDDGGDIITPAGKFSISPSPTQSLYIRANFDFTDSVGETIREAAVFVSGTVSAPPGTTYFLPEHVTSGGSMLILKRFTGFVRGDTTNETLNFVLEV